ncbi:N-acetylglutamate kinase [Melghirimyces profundicolus]|uniref:Acetylglutamate kinase n=1 Tax=Melghirimyces profundicolus TaxID=1242148 RepID=A0A2T6BUE5_9BACL|nr:acetylglutamate kinase [Melghirimyces profundicolus]PTX59683.1 N-acetylglutamate kinase [Melghirimyces profundicolus]
MRLWPVVIKAGGSVLERLHPSFFQELKNGMKSAGPPVIVHGGGPEISRLQKRLGLKTRFVKGLRVTDDEGLKAAEMVLAGTVNKGLTARLRAAGLPAVGLSGVDGALLEVKPKDPSLGWVGEVTEVHPGILFDLLKSGWIPVVASLGVDAEGRRYNVNADTAAGAVARALSARKLVMVTDVPGIRTEGATSRNLPSATPSEVREMVENGTIRGGMIPKVDAALAGLDSGVEEVIIADGSAPGALSGAGTRIRKEVEPLGAVSHLSEK